MGVESVREGIAALNRSSIPTYPTPEQAVKTFAAMYSYVRNLELLYETPKDISGDFVFDKVKVRALIEAEESDLLTESSSKRLLEAYGIPVVAAHLARSAEEAVSVGRRIGYPVVLKVLSPEIPHKSDAGGVLLGLDSDEAIRRGYASILEAMRTHYPSKRVDGVTVQKMITEEGYEVILGAKRDPVFGTVILLGMGGVAAEIFQDRAVSLPPLNERLAQRLLESIKGYRILKGFRNKPPVDLNLLKEILIRLSYLVVDFPAIKEMDINPLLIGPTGAWALDARVVVDKEALAEVGRPYSHLAIHPYPEEYVRTTELADGTPTTLRPIRPEDLPLWYDLLRTFSRQTIRFRYFVPGKVINHEMAVRNCFIDYEKELSVVAEVTIEDEKRLVGIGNVVFSSDFQNADLAVVVGDPWQGRGVGSRLMDFCIEIARQRGIRRITGDILPENQVVVEMAKRRGFELKDDGVTRKGTLDLCPHS
jgi:acetyltransferase